MHFLILTITALFSVLSLSCSKETKQTLTAAEEVIEKVESVELSELNEEERKNHIEEVTNLVNKLDYNSERYLEIDQNLGLDAAKDFFYQLSPEEQNKFVDDTFRNSAQAFLDSINKMEPEQRKELIAKVVEELSSKHSGDRLQELKETNRPVLQKIVQEGLAIYFDETSAESKEDLAPLLLELEKFRKKIKK